MHEGGVEAGADHRRRYPARGIGDHGRDHRGGIDRRRIGTGIDREAVPARGICAARNTFQFDRGLGLVVHGVPDPGQRGHGIEQPADARGRDAAQPAIELVPEHRPLRGRTGPDRGDIGRPLDTGGPQLRQRHPVRPVHTRIPTGQRHIFQMGESPVPLVPGSENFTAPDRPVGPVPGAVESDSQHGVVTAQPVFAHHRRDMGVMVLDGPHRAVARMSAGPFGGSVARMRIRGELTRAHAGQFLEMAFGGVEGSQGRQIVHITDVLTQPGIPSLGDSAGVLEVGAHGERRRDRCRQGQR